MINIRKHKCVSGKKIPFLSRNASIFPYVYHRFFFCLFVCFILSVEGWVGEASDSGIILAIKSRIIIQSRASCKFRVLYDACSVANIPRRVLGTRVNPHTCWIRVEGQIRFESGYRYVWTWKFFNPEGKSFGFKNIRILVDGGVKMIEKRVVES